MTFNLKSICSLEREIWPYDILFKLTLFVETTICFVTMQNIPSYHEATDIEKLANVVQQFR